MSCPAFGKDDNKIWKHPACPERSGVRNGIKIKN